MARNLKVLGWLVCGTVAISSVLPHATRAYTLDATESQTAVEIKPVDRQAFDFEGGVVAVGKGDEGD